MIIISAMSKDRVIGAGDGMPWDMPEEYEHYLETVRGATVIFGRKSYEIFGKDLDTAKLVVVTSQPELLRDEPDRVRAADGLQAALVIAAQDGGEVFVAGGASIYEQAIPLAQQMDLSTIHGNFSGDTYFPEFDRTDWIVTRLEEHDRYTFRQWVRIENHRDTTAIEA